MTNANEMAQKGFNTGFTDANDNELHVGDYVRIVAAFKEVLKDRPVYVCKGRFFSSVNISTEEETEEEKRQKILKKLSAEERRILGIEE